MCHTCYNDLSMRTVIYKELAQGHKLEHKQNNAELMINFTRIYTVKIATLNLSFNEILMNCYILVENLVFDQVCDQVFDKFVRVCGKLSTSFRPFCRKPGREPACSRFAAGSLVRARARQMECKKPVSSQPTNLLKLDFRYVFYYSCLS